MPIATETTMFFTHAFFLPLGLAFTVPGAGNVSASAKPDAADPVWAANSLGDVEEFLITPESEEYEKMAGRPGTLVVVDVVELWKKLTLKWKTQDVTPLAHQLLFGTLGLTGSSNQANPLEGDLMVKGWLKFQAYAGPSRRVTGDLWCRLKVTSAEPWSGRNIAQVEIEAKSIHSTLNTLKFE
jgi:hypothetical protein